VHFIGRSIVDACPGLFNMASQAVASPGFVARRKLCYGALTVDFRAGWNSVLMTNSFVINAVLIERAASCW